MVHRNSPSRSWCAFGTDAALTHASGSLQPRLPYQMILGGAGAADGSPPPDLFTLAVAVSHVVRTAIPCVSRSLCWNMQLLLRDASPRAMCDTQRTSAHRAGHACSSIRRSAFTRY